MAYYVTSDETLTDLADAIREKGGTTDPLEFPDEFISAIDDISTELPTQTKSATPTESVQTITPDTGYTLSSVSVGAISSDYVGSGVTRNDSTDLTASGATVTAPAGFYATDASKNVASGSVSVANQSLTNDPTISVNSSTGLITATVSGSKSVKPIVSAGYVSSGSSGTISWSGSKTEQLSTQAAKTVTPTESAQTAVTAGKYTTGAVTVAAIPSDYVGSGIDQRSSTDLTVSGATVTAPAGYYSESASKAVATGTAGTPTATKGTVSNHTISVTPSVTNTTGYITGGTKTGTAVTVQASELVSGTKSITTNGTGIDVANFSKVDVAVSGDVPVYQAKTGIVPTENSQTITADTGYDALSSVQIDAIDSDYVGSGIERRDDSDLTASGATVTVPAGYYEDTETKSVASGSATTPATTVTANPSISVSNSGLITATASATKSVTPTVSAGYVSSGTAGTITVSGSNTQQLSTQAATTYHPSTTDQTIASGKYLTGAQTIKAVTTTNLTPENILAGVTVKIGDSTDDDCVASVTGTASGGGGMVVVETLDEHGGTIVEITGEEIKLQAKTNISPTTSSQTIEPDNGYTGLSSVQINAMPSGSATAPNSISGTSATVSTGTNTLTLTKTVSVTPSVTAGYVASGTAGNSSVSLTASVTTKGTATITPTKNTQTIASGTYLTGTQTIAAIPAAYQDVTGVTAAAGDVVSGKSIVDSSGNTVNGSLVIQHYYTGSGTPSSSTGVNGDIYLQTS